MLSWNLTFEKLLRGTVDIQVGGAGGRWLAGGRGIWHMVRSCPGLFATVGSAAQKMSEALLPLRLRLLYQKSAGTEKG